MSESNVPINMTVKELKDILKDLPDDMAVIIPATDAKIDDDYNHIDCFVHVRTAGILETRWEEKPALCFNTSEDGMDISSQLKYSGLSTVCKKVLF